MTTALLSRADNGFLNGLVGETTYLDCKELAALTTVGSAFRAHQNGLFGASGDTRLESARHGGTSALDLAQFAALHLAIHDLALSATSGHARHVDGPVGMSA